MPVLCEQGPHPIKNHQHDSTLDSSEKSLGPGAEASIIFMFLCYGYCFMLCSSHSLVTLDGLMVSTSYRLVSENRRDAPCVDGPLRDRTLIQDRL